MSAEKPTGITRRQFLRGLGLTSAEAVLGALLSSSSRPIRPSNKSAAVPVTPADIPKEPPRPVEPTVQPTVTEQTGFPVPERTSIQIGDLTGTVIKIDKIDGLAMEAISPSPFGLTGLCGEDRVSGFATGEPAGEPDGMLAFGIWSAEKRQWVRYDNDQPFTLKQVTVKEDLLTVGGAGNGVGKPIDTLVKEIVVALTGGRSYKAPSPLDGIERVWNEIFRPAATVDFSKPTNEIIANLTAYVADDIESISPLVTSVNDASTVSEDKARGTGCVVLYEVDPNCLTSANRRGCERDPHKTGGMYEWMCVKRMPSEDSICQRDGTDGYAYAYRTKWYLCPSGSAPYGDMGIFRQPWRPSR